MRSPLASFAHEHSVSLFAQSALSVLESLSVLASAATRLRQLAINDALSSQSQILLARLSQGVSQPQSIRKISAQILRVLNDKDDLKAFTVTRKVYIPFGPIREPLKVQRLLIAQLMTTQPYEGYYLSTLSTVVDQAQALVQRLTQALEQTDQIQQDLGALIGQREALKINFREARAQISVVLDRKENALRKAAEAGLLAERADKRLKELTEMMSKGSKDPNLFSEIGRAANAKETKIEERDRFRTVQDEADKALIVLQSQIKNAEIGAEKLGSQIKEKQKELPDPHLFAYVSLAHLGRANAHLLLTQNLPHFTQTLVQAVDQIERMHRELKEGRYRLDRFGDLLAGRHESSIQALCAAIVTDDFERAQRLFGLITDPNMCFHHIFNVFRTWLFGAYLAGDEAALARILRVHRYDQGVWRGYVRAFVGLLEGHEPSFRNGLSGLLRFKQLDDESTFRIPGLGLVHLPALALIHLGRRAGFQLHSLESWIPESKIPPILLPQTLEQKAEESGEDA